MNAIDELIYSNLKIAKVLPNNPSAVVYLLITTASKHDRQQTVEELSTEMHQTLWRPWRESCLGFSNVAGPQGDRNNGWVQ